VYTISKKDKGGSETGRVTGVYASSSSYGSETGRVTGRVGRRGGLRVVCWGHIRDCVLSVGAHDLLLCRLAHHLDRMGEGEAGGGLDWRIA
jgi:hypothetical protein